MKNNHLYTLAVAIIVLLAACEKETAPTDISHLYMAGGATTIFDVTSNAFSTPAPNLTQENLDEHLVGDATFEQEFVTDPAEVNAGLGPVFNNTSCIACHSKDGRAFPPQHGSDLSGLLIRLSIPGTDANGGPNPAPNFGGQLQTRANFGVEAESDIEVSFEDHIVNFPDGSSVMLEKPVYTIVNPYTTLPSDLMQSSRIAPPVFGLGLLEAIPESAILANADPDDTNNDGISGKPNYGYNVLTQQRELGRFGWKATEPTALQQTAGAYNQDMGVTSYVFPEESSEGQSNGTTHDGLMDITDDVLDVTNFYVQTLAVPAPRDLDDPTVIRGYELFTKELQCASCHIPSFTTGSAVIDELANQKIYAYTDMLLHDMGEALADNRPDYDADGREWRTAPLWGIGLTALVNGHTRFLHDGRARNLEEAVLWHGGEAEKARNDYWALSKADKEAVIAFLQAL